MSTGLRISPTDQPLSSERSFIFRVATGNSQEIVPAPPAGYMTYLAVFKIINESTTTALDWRVSDALGMIVGGTGSSALPTSGAGAAPATNSNSGPSVFIPLLSRSALTLAISGAGGTPAVIFGCYSYIPIGNIKETVLTLTTSFQTIDPSCVPTDANTIATIVTQAGPYTLMSFAQNLGFVMNDDTAVAIMVFRLTRGAITTLWASTTNVAKIRAQALSNLPHLQQGDVFEVKLASAPAVTGSITWRQYWAHIPIQV